MNKTSLGNTTVTMSDVEDIVRRIVEVAQPEKVILFGSAARGEVEPHSDLDFLIIKSGAHRRQLSVRIRRSLYGVAASLDIVVATPEDIERYKDSSRWCTNSLCGRGWFSMTRPERFPQDDQREWLNRARSNLSRARRRASDIYLEDLLRRRSASGREGRQGGDDQEARRIPVHA